MLHIVTCCRHKTGMQFSYNYAGSNHRRVADLEMSLHVLHKLPEFTNITQLIYNTFTQLELS
jgi:hypothetical protein